MDFLQLSECQKDWNFSPQSPWPEALPAYSWQGQVLAGFKHPTSSKTVVLSATKLSEALKACYPSLSLSELARLALRLKKSCTETDLAEIFQIYGQRYHSGLFDICEKIATSPMSFQNWAAERKLSPKDLSPLKLIEPATLTPFLEALATKKASSSTGKKIIEWGIEVFLIEESLEAILSPSEQSAEDWLTVLKSRRYPKSTERDQSQTNKLHNLRWPKGIRGSWQRSGDQTHLNISLNISSTQDFEDKLQQLQKISQNAGDLF